MMTDKTDTRYILTIQCRDTMGIVAAVAGFLAGNDASIVEASQFHEPATNRFFQRTVFTPAGPRFPGAEDLKTKFAAVATRFAMDWALTDLSQKPGIVIAVSHFGHCLYDLLHRWRSGTLPVEIAAIVSNHEDMRDFVEWNRIPFRYMPVTPETRAQQEHALLALMESEGAELLVLARYMQVLSPDLCAALEGRCINIHHSFLPGFKGARPYHQAHARGVKIIGATAHYVTAELDDGPIIEQAIERVDHAHEPKDLIEIGRDIECRVLARAVRWHIERRIIVSGNRTIVFR